MTRRFGLIALTACAFLAGAIAATSALAAFPGTNGRIAWSNNPGTPGTNDDIYAIDANGVNRAQLTTSADHEDDPSYSADGERIVYTRYPDASPSVSQVWVMNQDGSGQTQLTNVATEYHYEPAFSPDGTKIVYERSGTTSQIWIMNADGTGQTQLTVPGAGGDEGYAPQFSPDGTKIVFSRFDSAANRTVIATIAPNGTNLLNLTTPPATADDEQPSYSPNGAKIVFTRDGAVTAINADGTGLAPLTTPATGGNDYGPTFSPDGTQYLFERGTVPFTGGFLFLGNPAGPNLALTQIPNQPTGYNFNATWQPLNPPACNVGPDIKTKKYGKVTVTVTCANENVLLKASGAGKVKKVGRAVAAKKKKFTIPEVSALVAANVPTAVELKVPKGAKRALKRAAKAGVKGKATITATIVDDLGQTASDSVAVTFKPKR